MNNPLAELKDIHVPATIDGWPPAYGWWLLAALVLACIVYLVVLAIKHRHLNLAKQQAKAELKSLSAQTPNWPVVLNSLIKRLVISYFPGLAVQHLHGQKWTDFVTQTLPEKHQKQFANNMLSLQNALYHPNQAHNLVFEDTCQLVENWIKHSRLKGPKAEQRCRSWLKRNERGDDVSSVQGEQHV